MNFIDTAFEQKLCGDDFLQAMADIYKEPKVRQILNNYPLFVQDIINIIDYDSAMQIDGFDEIINGSLAERYNDILSALTRCGLMDEVAVITDAKKLDEENHYEYDHKYNVFSQKIALHNDYDKFWNAVRQYIDSNISY